MFGNGFHDRFGAAFFHGVFIRVRVVLSACGIPTPCRLAFGRRGHSSPDYIPRRCVWEWLPRWRRGSPPRHWGPNGTACTPACRTCRRRTTFVCVCVCVRVCAGFWVAMADQGQTPGRPLVTTSAGRGSNTFRGPSGSWPGSSPSRRRAPADWPYGNHTAGTSRLATRAAGLNDPLRQEGTWEAPIN